MLTNEYDRGVTNRTAAYSISPIKSKHLDEILEKSNLRYWLSPQGFDYLPDLFGVLRIGPQFQKYFKRVG